MTEFWSSFELLLRTFMPPELSLDSLYLFSALMFGILVFLYGKIFK